MSAPSTPHSTFTLDPAALHTSVNPDTSLTGFGDSPAERICGAVAHAEEHGALHVPDGIELVLVALRNQAAAVIIGLRPAPGQDHVISAPDSELTFERMLASWRVPLDRLTPTDRRGFKRLCATLHAVCEEANILLPHYHAMLAGEQHLLATTPARLNVLYRDGRESVAITDTPAARALAAELNGDQLGAAQDPDASRWRCAQVTHDDVAAIRGLCDKAQIPVPAAVVAALIGNRTDRLWLTVPRAQAEAVAEWAYDGPQPDCVQLSLRGSILIASQGDEGTSRDLAGNEVDHPPVTPDDAVIAFPLEPGELKQQVADAAVNSATQVTLTSLV